MDLECDRVAIYYYSCYIAQTGPYNFCLTHEKVVISKVYAYRTRANRKSKIWIIIREEGILQTLVPLYSFKLISLVIVSPSISQMCSLSTISSALRAMQALKAHAFDISIPTLSVDKEMHQRDSSARAPDGG